MTSDTADKTAGYIALGLWVLCMLAVLTQPASLPGSLIAAFVFSAVAGVIVRLGLGLFVRKS